MKRYHEIEGDGGSNVARQVVAQQEAVHQALAGVRHIVALASGKGGVGKSTLTMALARSLQADGRRVAVLDADLNGPCQARMARLEGAPWVPGEGGLRLPRTADGIGVASLGSLLADTAPLRFDSVAEGDEQTWRATREFALFTQLLGAVSWGELDALLMDLPPGTERTSQFAHVFGDGAAFVLVTLPSAISRGVVARSVSELAGKGRRVLGYVENMSGYYCRDCDEVRPLFPTGDVDLPLPCLGRVPFDPELARLCDDGFGDDGFGGDDCSGDGPPALAEIATIGRRVLQSFDAPPSETRPTEESAP